MADHSPVRVTARPHPFRLNTAHHVVPAGATLAEIVERTMTDPGQRHVAHVCIEGHLVPREHWRLVRPKPGTLVEVVAGLGEDGKSPMRTVLTLAVIAASAWVAGGGLAAGAWFAAGSTSASVAAAAVGSCGAQLVGSRLPVPA